MDQPPASADQLGALIRRAEKGDASALAAVRRVLADPEAVEILGGNLAECAERALLDRFCGDGLLAREAITRKMQLLRAELSGPDPSAVERLLAERAVVCWLHLYHLENAHARRDSTPLDLGMYFQKAIDRAHKRYLTALKALAEVRRLAVPAVQVNIAKRQVNIAGGPATTTSGSTSRSGTERPPRCAGVGPPRPCRAVPEG